MPHDCFLSYSSKDLSLAEAVHAHLVAAGFDVWLDKIRLKPGFLWHGEIEAACESSRIVLPLLTPNWKVSEWTRYETYGAENIIPLLTEGKWDDVTTPPLKRYQNAATSYDSSDAAWQALIEGIREILSKPSEKRDDRVVLLDHNPIEHFVGRDELLTEIHERLFRSPVAALTQGRIQAVTALGGVGKTTLARHYAEKFWRPYRQIFWVDCRAGLETGFARIHDRLRSGNEFATLPQEVKANWAREELSNPQRELRLLILDNAEDQDSIMPWLPNTGNCHTLITSRFTAWTGAIEKCEVWVLEPGPARELLMKSSGITDSPAENQEAERPHADAVAAKLEYLPLALEQAAAYVRQQPQGFGFAGYLRLYQENERRMLEAGTRGATDYPASVYLTWKATVEKLPQGARRILAVHAWVAPLPFPVDLYIKGAEAIAPGAREIDVREWIGALVNYSMAQRQPGDAISVHGLVQAVERHRAAEAGEGTYTAMRWLFGWHAEKPSWEPASRKLWDLLLPHAEALRAHAAGQPASGDPNVLWKMGEAYNRRGDYRRAIPSCTECLAIFERVLGTEHPDTLISVNNLAHLYDKQGCSQEAEPLLRRAIKAYERVLGAEHPETLTSVNNLAELHRGQGRYQEAEPLYRRALEAYERVLGAEHPSTLTAVNNLTQLYRSQGRYQEAEPLLHRALEARERVLGAEHPDTLGSVSNLALLYTTQGRYVEAEPLYRRVLEARERVLGAEHPDTLGSVNNLAALYDRQGRYQEAEPLYRRALEARERLLGAEHPDTLQSVNNLASWYYSQGRYQEAEPLLRRALEAHERVLGLEHPDTVISVNNLAGLYYNQGRYQEAEPLLRRALEAHERVLGLEHPDTVISVNNLAALYGRQGRYEEAEPLLRRALEGLRKAFGPEHPHTRLYARNYEEFLAAMGREKAR
jgi:tetratricopeptide (TPR) repeat protein